MGAEWRNAGTLRKWAQKKPTGKIKVIVGLSTMIREFCGRVWENGEFGIAVSKKMVVEPVSERVVSPAQAEHEQWVADLLDVHGAEEVLKYYGFDPLGFSPLPNSHNNSLRGLKGITSHGKRLVRNACRRLEVEVGKEFLSFLTVTVPDVGYLESIAISQGWAEVVRVFLQRLKRALVKAGLPGEIVGVTEIQEKRVKRDGILALHLHLMFVGRSRGQKWALTPSDVRSAWSSALAPYLDEPVSSYCWDAVENIQRVLKSCEGYLGKYMSKGASTVDAAIDEFGEEAMPRSWYACTNSLRKRVVSKIRVINQPMGTALINACCDELSTDFHYRKPIVLRGESGRDVVIGWFGKIRDDRISKYMSIGKDT